MSLHFFAILIACKLDENVLPNVKVADIRVALDESLATLQAIERTSLMSQKARSCLAKLLEVYDVLSTEAMQVAGRGVRTPKTTVADTTTQAEQNVISDFIWQSTDDFLQQCSQNYSRMDDITFWNAFDGQSFSME